MNFTGQWARYSTTIPITEVQDEISSFLDSASVQSLNHTNREWRHCRGDNGEHKHVHVTSANIGSILESFTNPPDPNIRWDHTRLDRASFEIRVFDKGVRDRFAELCRYARRLKINFRMIPTECLKTWSVWSPVEMYNRIVEETLSVLKTAPRLLSLHLHFGIEVRRQQASDMPYVRHTPGELLLYDSSIRMISDLWAAPALSRLYINLANNELSHRVVEVLCLLRHSVTLNVLSINLDDNHRDLLGSIQKLGGLAFYGNLGTLHLSLRNFQPLKRSALVERHFGWMFDAFSPPFRHSPPKLYLDLENNSLTTQSLRGIASIRAPTLHFRLGSFDDTNEHIDEAIRILNELGTHVHDLMCHLVNPHSDWVMGRLAQVGIVPPWSVGTFMDGFVHWNQ
jgi:hypothetical protein